MSLPRVQTRVPSELESHASTEGEASGAPALHVVTFGCQMNKYDSLLVEGRFLQRGYRLTERLEDADVVLFNTCSVRDHAEERVYSWVGALAEAKRRRPELVVGVMGCMAQRVEGEVFRRASHVDLVCGTRQLTTLPELVDEVRERRRRSGGAGSQGLIETSLEGAMEVDRRSEPYRDGLVGHLAVMRGCDLNCTYCVVPATRGRVQSRPIDDLVAEARWMIEGGARVLTLLGQTVNSYGEDLPVGEGTGRRGRPGLSDLLRALQELEGLERIRLITLHPSYVTRALAEAIRDCEKVDRFLPLPVQSGSDRILRAMKRGYTTDLYRERIALLREEVPDIELGSDWIVGFPSETDEDFERSAAFLDEIGFVQNYVFQYSPRPDTRAFALPDDVPIAAKKERNRILLEAAERSSLARMETRLGGDVSAFVEATAPKSPGSLRARTVHNLPVRFEGDEKLIGTTVRVRIEAASPYGLSGALAEQG